MKTIDFNNPGELVLNESFIGFVKGTDQESVGMWKEYIRNHPEKKEMTDKAAAMVSALLHAKKSGNVPDREDLLAEIMKHIDEPQYSVKKPTAILNSAWFKIAAVGLLILGLSSLWGLFHNKSVKYRDLTYNEIIVPLGEKAQIVLSDGTHVWINSDSRLRYPVKFGEESRDVILEGEAYFDVAKRHDKVFVVNTRDVKVNVLGTAFNVKCYPGDEKTQTTVVRGSVKVEDILGKHKPVIIKPNEMAILEDNSANEKVVSSQSTTITVHRVDPENLISWKDQMLDFNDESFEDLAVKMERWFNVNIKIDNEELRTQRYNGKFVHNETVYQVLEAIRLTTPITYQVARDTIIISLK